MAFDSDFIEFAHVQYMQPVPVGCLFKMEVLYGRATRV